MVKTKYNLRCKAEVDSENTHFGESTTTAIGGRLKYPCVDSEPVTLRRNGLVTGAAIGETQCTRKRSFSS